MQLFVTVLHIFLCLALIGIIILQPGKTDVAAAFGGGGGNQMYAPRGQGHFLGKATTVVAFMFMFTSITLALYSTERVSSGSSDIEDEIRRLEEDKDEGWSGPTTSTKGEPVPTDEAAPEGIVEGANDEGDAGQADEAAAEPSEAPVVEPAPTVVPETEEGE